MVGFSSFRHCPRRFLWPLAAVALLGLIWGGTMHSPVASQSLQAAGGDARRAPASAGAWQGVASCASTACHGGNGPRGSQGSEYTTWVQEDKHTKAYQVLFDGRSRLIEKNLRHLASLKEAHAEADALCLGCHAMNPEDGPQSDRFVRDFGIGCESCHGTAQAWLGVHYARDWKTKSEAEKLALGFRPLTRLGERARLCVTCHVGTPGKEVNHDLIAAGHPRLNFEFGAFQALMPKHWREAGENTQPDLEARAWVIGQLVSARAALALLEQRARAASSPWPEFAEYDCFACHHGLQEPSWRQDASHYANRTPGALPWGSWYYPMLGLTLRRAAAVSDAQVQNRLSQLKREMQLPAPNRERVAEQAHEASTELDRLVSAAERRHFARAALESLFSTLRRDDEKAAAASWDGAAQLYLALAALYNALAAADGGQGDPALRDSLQKRAQQLGFPKGYDSPRGFQPK